jgi:hypothetical protein
LVFVLCPGIRRDGAGVNNPFAESHLNHRDTEKNLCDLCVSVVEGLSTADVAGLETESPSRFTTHGFLIREL